MSAPDLITTVCGVGVTLSDAIVGVTCLILIGHGAIFWCTVIDARKKEKRELRAYVYPTGKSEIRQNEVISPAEGGIRQIWCDVGCINSGRIPATRVFFDWRFSSEEFKTFRGELGNKFTTSGLPDIGPNQDFWITGAMLMKDIVFNTMVTLGTGFNLYFWGRIRYCDGWEEKVIPFCFLYIKSNLPGGERMRWIQPEPPPQST